MNSKKSFVKLFKEFTKMRRDMDAPRLAHMGIEVSSIKASANEYPPAYVTADILESLCGLEDESQPVEQYDGTLGVQRQFVDQHQSKVAQIQWNNDLRSKYSESWKCL